ncbi:hypothetical protein QJS04_geneDACA011659 [Acorus gramineus]|uniref:Uncharacterized protein n=1 Tax=Acorus gramineus TaxID=55184 RepID=A0AAV9BJ27_ACOGR|nr:hypothetical protein QJS04_geneDACA011659 [Acorus gramineus]
MATFLSSPTTLLCSRASKLHHPSKPTPFHRLTLTCMAKNTKSTDDTTTTTSTVELAAIAGGLVSGPVILWSLYTLKTTGCGLPPGPGGSIGALEGVSYLVVLGIVAWSAYTKSKTGSGLRAGPFGLLGAVEGLSYLVVLGIVVVFGLQFLERGYIPGPVPDDQCFG